MTGEKVGQETGAFVIPECNYCIANNNTFVAIVTNSNLSSQLIVV